MKDENRPLSAKSKIKEIQDAQKGTWKGIRAEVIGRPVMDIYYTHDDEVATL